MYGLVIWCGPTVHRIAEDMAISQLRRRYPVVGEVTVSWLWEREWAYRDDDEGETFVRPAGWAVFVEGDGPPG
jgi:hypothetical protein